MREPTRFPGLNRVLALLVTELQAVLGPHLAGVYLQGSFALGAGDAHSDVDVLMAVTEPLSALQVAHLQELHERIFRQTDPWAQHIEGSYFPLALLREPPDGTPLWYLDNGSRRLELSTHDNELVVRWMTRERGIVLYGPPPADLIPPVDPQALRREVWQTMQTWAAEMAQGRYPLANQWAQAFTVLSYCRMLQTLATGRIDTKPAGVTWALQELPEQWHGLIERAWANRPDPSLKYHSPADPAEVAATHALIAAALERGRQYAW